MYYSNEQNYNDYYVNYKKELQELNQYHKKENINKLILLGSKIVMIILFLGLSYYLYKNYITNSSKINFMKEESIVFKTNNEDVNLPSIEIDSTVLPKSIQLRDSNLQSIKYIKQNATDHKNNIKIEQIATAKEKNISINPKDVALIVQIIMSQIQTKQSLEKKSIVNNEFIHELDKAETQKTSFSNLKEGNYYNKIVIQKSNISSTQDNLIKLRDNMNALMQEKIVTNEAKSYTESLKKEISVRSDEMRIIIVQKGDSLSKLAKKAYGNYDAYPKILKANPEIIKNPNQIYAGMRLRIPQY